MSSTLNPNITAMRVYLRNDLLDRLVGLRDNMPSHHRVSLSRLLNSCIEMSTEDDEQVEELWDITMNSFETVGVHENHFGKGTKK